MTFSLGTGTHIAFSSPAVETLSRLGAVRLIRAADQLLIGPSRKDPIEHVRSREEFLGSTLLPIAGFEAYSASAPWVIHDDRRIARR